MTDRAVVKTLIDFTNALYHNGNIDRMKKEEIRDMLSSGQIYSKGWLLEQLRNCRLMFASPSSELRAITCGGWVGFLAQLINNDRINIHADTLDLSEDSTAIARSVVVDGQAILGDMYSFDYAPYDIIINTAAEHIPDVQAWSDSISKEKILVVQSNDARQIEEHVSCVDSAEELAEKLNLSEVYYMDSMKFSMYTRFMVIGKK
jgi:hypothetical protein